MPDRLAVVAGREPAWDLDSGGERGRRQRAPRGAGAPAGASARSVISPSFRFERGCGFRRPAPRPALAGGVLGEPVRVGLTRREPVGSGWR